MNKERFSIGIVSPVKNEQDMLPKLASIILSQTKLPAHWLIVDDGSSDNTPKIIEDLKKRYNWITSIKLPDRGHYSRGLGSYANSIKGFVQMLKLSDVEALGICDADISFEKTAIAQISEAFLSSNKLGIYGGDILELKNGKWVDPLLLPQDFVRGACKFYRKQCYLDIGGMKLGKSSNVISNMEALMHGWEVKRDPKLLIKHHRLTGSRDNYIQRYTKAGTETAYIGSDLLLTIVRGVRKMFQSKPYVLGGVIFLATYLDSAFIRKNQYPNPKLLKFIQKRHREILLQGFYNW